MPRREVMGLVYVHAFGCRTSLCEGEYIAGELLSLGHEITEELAPGISSAVIVTCSVTAEADRKCRQLVRRVRKVLGDVGILAVCGCWSQALDADTACELGIDILAGSKGKSLVPSAVCEMLEHGRKFTDIRGEFPSGWEELPLSSTVMHSRAFVKVQDGCDHFCAYCVIPFLRGKPVSRQPQNVTDEIRRLIDSGVKEVVLTGIHLGAYGRDIGMTLADLVRNVGKVDGLRRLRLGSLEPFCLDRELLVALADCEAFCHHLHLPLQSGDDGVLSAMRRGYTAEDFVRTCDEARSAVSPDIHISADILVGFPGETEAAFTNTLRVMREAGLGRVHVFPYSAREGTLAAKMPGQVPHTVKVSRASRAIALGRELFAEYAGSFVGHEAEILIERDGRGHTRHYVEAVCEGGDNEIVRAGVMRFVDGRLECLRGD